MAEPFSGLKSTAAVTDAYFDLYFAAMGQGRTRTVAEIGRMASRWALPRSGGFDAHAADHGHGRAVGLSQLKVCKS